MPNYDLKAHSHGSVSSDGKIGTESGKIVTTGTGGVLQASDKINTSQIDNFPSTMTPSSHTHGNLQNNGQVGSSVAASKNVVTDSEGKITTEDKPTIPTAGSSAPPADVSGGAVGSSSNFAKADHQHPLSTAYAASGHNHTVSNISDVTTLAVTITYTDDSTETKNLLVYSPSS